jgi:hypothetical protein
MFSVQQLHLLQHSAKNALADKKHIHTSSDVSDPPTPRKIEDAKNISIYNNVIAFTLFELETITKSFRADYVLGEGGFGTVYKGYIDENVRVGLKSLPVAVKVLNKDGHQGHREWLVSNQVVPYFSCLVVFILYMGMQRINNYYKNFDTS